MPTDQEIHSSNIDAMRREFLRDVASAAPRDENTTYAEWDAAIHTYLTALRPWLKDDDLLLHGRSEFCVLPGSSLPFSVYGYGYFRAWLRKQGLKPEDVSLDHAAPPTRAAPDPRLYSYTTEFDQTSTSVLADQAITSFAQEYSQASPEQLAAQRVLFLETYRRAKRWRHQHPQANETNIRQAINRIYDEMEAPNGRDDFGEPLEAPI
jgi:hypothetical protein